jgi:hypothetical protein
MSNQPAAASMHELASSVRSPTRGAEGPRARVRIDMSMAQSRLATPAAVNSKLVSISSHPNQSYARAREKERARGTDSGRGQAKKGEDF